MAPIHSSRPIKTTATKTDENDRAQDRLIIHIRGLKTASIASNRRTSGSHRLSVRVQDITADTTTVAGVVRDTEDDRDVISEPGSTDGSDTGGSLAEFISEDGEDKGSMSYVTDGSGTRSDIDEGSSSGDNDNGDDINNHQCEEAAAGTSNSPIVINEDEAPLGTSGNPVMVDN
ncbi:hypothetical protein SCUP234_01270 [Seiridium cupressi]